MGFFDFLTGKEKEIILLSPFEGHIIALQDVPDEAVAGGLIGQGIAVLPEKDTAQNIFKQPIHVFKTGHAFTYEVQKVEIIVHIGVDTVALKGEGFSVLVENEKVYPVGKDVVKFDMQYIQNKNISLISSILIANMEAVKHFELLVNPKDAVSFGQALFKFTPK